MRVLGSAVLAIEAIVVFLGTALAASNGSVSNTGAAWATGLILMTLLIVGLGTLGHRWGVWFGWVLQVLVLATSLVVGWTMLVIGLIFAVLWIFAVRQGRRVDALRAGQGDQ